MMSSLSMCMKGCFTNRNIIGDGDNFKTFSYFFLEYYYLVKIILEKK
jgi:hypothetical protein